MWQVAMEVVTYSHFTTITMHAMRIEDVGCKLKPASSSWQLRCPAQRSLEGSGPQPQLQPHLGHTHVCVSLGILYRFSHTFSHLTHIEIINVR